MMPEADTDSLLDRLCAQHQIGRRELLIIELFGRGHPDASPLHLLFDFVRGVSAAAVAAGRTKCVPVLSVSERRAA